MTTQHAAATTLATPVATLAAPPLDAARRAAFSGHMLQIVNDGFLALLVSVGRQTGLFETMAALPPAGADEIATIAGLQPRYVREWLGGMVVGGIVEYDPSDARFWLPREHAAALTRAAGPNNLAVLASVVPLMAEVEQQVVACFRDGGGVPYAAYPRFQQLQAEFSAQFHDAALLEHAIPVVPELRERLEAGIQVLDVGSGSGRAVHLLAERFPASEFTGYDISTEGIARARAEGEARGLRNVRFEQRDAAELDERARYDLVTAFDVIHDLAQPRQVLRAVARALRPGGVFLMVDIAASSRLEENVGHPLAAYLYGVSTFHCMTVSLAQGGEGLGTVWGEQQTLALLAEAGFADVAVRRVDADP